MTASDRYLDAKTGRGRFSVDEARKKPNILMITLAAVPPELGCAGGADGAFPVQTPAVAALRREGLSYSNAFAASPLGTASRAAMFTGRFAYISSPPQQAHPGQATALRPEDSIFPEYLRAAGYHTRQVGHCGVGAAHFIRAFSENNTPWEQSFPPWFDDDNYLAFLGEHELQPFTFQREIRGEAPGGKAQGASCGGWLAAQNDRAFPREATYPAYLVSRAVRALEAWQPAGGPFYVQLDFFAPHRPFALPGNLEKREEELRKHLELPPSYIQLEKHNFAPPWEEPRVYRMYRKYWGFFHRSTLLDYMVANVLQLELVDEVLKSLFAYLKERGLYDQTTIILTADHGEMNGEFALIDSGVFLHPKVMRVPLIIKPAADHPKRGAGTLLETPVSLVDLAPTVLELAGIHSQERQDGLNLFRLADARKRPVSFPLLFEAGSDLLPNPCVGMVFLGSDQEHYLYAYNLTDDIDELYPLNTPWESRNTAPTSRGGEIYKQAIRKLDAVLSGDSRWCGYSQCFRLENAELLPECAAPPQPL